ncbi:MAG: hypothetical protein MUE85_01080 [Microscillaceae bacterium]|jgi:hypothetical protein|nr:hypothetical protein [Microscillaceae bacterium]
MKKSLKIVILGCLIGFSMNQVFAQIDLKKARDQVKKQVPTNQTKKETPNLPKKNTEMNKNSTSNNNSQNPADTTSPAKGFIKQFWANIEKMENMPEEKRNVVSIGNYSRAAQTAINNIKMKDKSYNTAPLESELQKWKDKYEEANAARGKTRETRTDAVKIYSKLFDSSEPIPYYGHKPEQIAQCNQKIEEYNAELAKYLAGDKDQATIDGFIERVETRFFKSLDKFIAEYEDCLKNGSELRPMLGCLQELRIREAITNAAKQVYPQNSAFAEGHQKVQAAINRAENLDLEAIAKANAEKQLREARVPAAVTSNPAIEQEFRNAFAKTGWGETILKINLLSHDWNINRNELTSVIENRTQTAAIVTKNANGKCIVYGFTIAQDYMGGGTYGGSYRFRHNGYEVLCENVK